MIKIPCGLFAVLIVPVSLLLSSCDKDNTSSKPDVLLGSGTLDVPEDIVNGDFILPVYLSSESEKEITIDYSTADSTASAGTDYIAATSGKLTIQPGLTSGSINLKIVANSSVKEDVFFKVVFSNPVNCELPVKKMVVKIINTDFATLAWSDEFTTGPSLNTAVWNYELGAGGWGNNELETYTNSLNNVHIDTGYLHITALNPSANYYTSGRITTKGKKEFKWFRVDIRAKLPEGQGLWPALWMLGANFSSVGWPSCGEIDIMEYLGHASTVSYGALHWNSGGHTYRTGTFTLPAGKFSTEFHIFSLVWTPTTLRWYVDNQEFFTQRKTEVPAFPFDLPQFFIFNVAVGGNWPGKPDGTTVFPQHMIVDYVRVYQ
jgi:hypothetical protein